VDLPNALPDEVLLQMCVSFGLDPDDVLLTSAKSGFGVAPLLPAIVARVPPPASLWGRAGPCRARVVDSWFDDHRGVICLVQVAVEAP
jgi:GTP-binding protein LepA